MAEKKAAVVGAGAIGQTTAYLLQEQGYSVAIYSDRYPEQTTSTKAGAVFEPYKLGPTPRLNEMLAIGLDRFEKVIKEYYPNCGAWMHHLYMPSDGLIDPEDCEFLEAMKGRLIDQDIPGGYKSSLLFYVPMIDPTVYIPWLHGRFLDKGGRLKLQKIHTMEQMSQLPFELIFNCSGLGSRELLGDFDLYPVRGQIVVLDCKVPWDFSILDDQGYYVFPRERVTILGGTTEANEYSEITTDEAISKILEYNKRTIPDLADLPILKTYAGLRPYREMGVNISAQEIDDKKVIHNYGHGGSGITLSWGSAQLALELI